MEQNISDRCCGVEMVVCDQTLKPGFSRFFGLSLLVHMVFVSSFMLMQRNMPVASLHSPPVEVEIHDMEMKKAEPSSADKAVSRAIARPAMSPKVVPMASPQPAVERLPSKIEPVQPPTPLQPASTSPDAAPVLAHSGPTGPVVAGAVTTGTTRLGSVTGGGGGGTSNKIHDLSFGSGNGPSFLTRVDPSYPLAARRMGREGKVLLRLTLDERGKLLHVDVLENPGYGFADAAVDAVRKSRFLPAHISDRPVASRVRLPIRFALQTAE